MRVFLCALIILVLVACNSATDEVAVQDTTVEVLADTAQFVVEVFDSIENEIEEKVKDLEVNATNDRLSEEVEYFRIEDERMKLISKLKKGEAIRIHSDSLAYFGFYDFDGNEIGDYNIDGYLFTGVSFQTFDNGVVKRETDFEKGKKLIRRK
tara:strand:+ start:612 stop:1070 length:459 start_codon:yes stop_codon:yes gene_type:complete